MSEFQDQLQEIRQRLALYSLEDPERDKNLPLPPRPLGKDVHAALEKYLQDVKAVYGRFRDPVESEEQEQEVHAGRQEAKTSEAGNAAVAKIMGQMPQENTGSNSPYLNNIQHHFGQLKLPKVPLEFQPSDEEWDVMTPSVRALYAILSNEIYDAQNDSSENSLSVVVLQKLRQAMQALVQGKIKELIALMSGARRDDPKNRMIAFMLSQLHYFRVHHGQSKLLPEARAESHNACTQDERVDPEKTRYYRFMSITAERLISAERTAELIRQFTMLNPEGTSGPDGLTAHKGIHFQTWLVLSTIPHKHWTEYEIEALASIANHTVMGAAFYMHYMRPVVEAANKDKNALFNEFNKIEQTITKVYQRYQGVAKIYLSEYDAQKGLPKGLTHRPWTVLQNYLQHVLTVSRFPSFGHILMNISLDGRRYLSEVYPTTKLQQQDLDIINYWRCWAVTITPDDELRSNRLPLYTAVAEAQILQEYDTLLEKLQTEEKGGLSEQKWRYVDDYLESYSINDIYQIGYQMAFKTSRDTRNAFNFINIIRDNLSQPVENQKFPAQLIDHAAQVGMFLDLRNVHDVFEGVNVLIHDRNHKPKSRLERALEHIQKLEKEEQESSFLEDHMRSFGWLYFLVLPIAVFTFLVIVFLGN